MLTIKCRHLASAYDSAMEEVGRLRHEVRMLSKDKQIELDSHIKRNTLRLSKPERSLELLCEYEEPSRSFGDEITNSQFWRV